MGHGRSAGRCGPSAHVHYGLNCCVSDLIEIILGVRRPAVGLCVSRTGGCIMHVTDCTRATYTCDPSRPGETAVRSFACSF